MSLLIFVKKS